MNMDINKYVETVVKNAKKAAFAMNLLSEKEKNACLLTIAEAILAAKESIKEANSKDLANAHDNNLTAAMIDRLTLNDERIIAMSENFSSVADLNDPVGRKLDSYTRPNGLIIDKISVPIGVIGMIFESRPNVTCEASALCIKSGNAVILRGGKEAIFSNCKIAEVIANAMEKNNFPKDAVQMIQDTDRAIVQCLLKQNEYVDLIIPRGGKSLIKTVVENSTIPVIKHYNGICHTYIDADADFQMAKEISLNAKTQRPGVCNAMETLLINKDFGTENIKKLIEAFLEQNTQIRGCPRTKAIVPEITEATELDWDTEYLELILSVKIVDTINEAIEHISNHGSKHSEAIISNNVDNCTKFTNSIDASAVFINSSTRFNDGGEFGFGAEIGISTDKLHARGPMALNELTTYKYIVKGTGQIRK